jgi:hypothetical protein
MLTKMVDGKQITCSDSEEKLIRMMWSLNDKYPEYSGHLMFDGVSEPKHNIEACKFSHRQMVESIIAKKIATINLNIETAEESGDDSAKKTLLEARKSLKGQLNYDDSIWNTIDDCQKHLEMIKAL